MGWVYEPASIRPIFSRLESTAYRIVQPRVHYVRPRSVPDSHAKGMENTSNIGTADMLPQRVRRWQ